LKNKILKKRILRVMEIIDYHNYLIYDDGRVYSKNRNRFLKPHLNSTGYYMINLYKDGKKKYCKIHRLVASHYIPLVDGKNMVDHIDRNKTNNDISNLRWVNNSENNLNKGVHKNNVLGHKLIRLTKNNTYKVHIKRNKKDVYQKTFKTLEEAIVGRDDFIKTL
jgi:hypothetical protein